MPGTFLATAVRLAVLGAFCAFAWAPPAAAQTVPPDARFPLYNFYVGAGVSGVHHTGYVPGTPFNSETYRLGGKAFLGYHFNEWIAVEATYHYLGQGEFNEGFATPSRERSHAVGATGLLFFPTMMPDHFPTRFYVRGGFAYKDITHVSAVGTFHEGVASWVAGFGLEFEFTSRFFMRLEYEFVSRGIGGTNRAINVMHTPLSASVGFRF